jgi:signal-transduction protein with cAMP-binding, CBS, and nucleotidyltransferase domain
VQQFVATLGWLGLACAMITSRPTSLVTFLHSVPIFGGLEGASLDRLFDLLQEQTWRPGEVIFNEAELGRTMYVLREGEVEVSRKNTGGTFVPIVTLGPGETFGEMTLVELQPRSATVTVTRKADSRIVDFITVLKAKPVPATKAKVKAKARARR